jgi:hypothetical protein
MSLGYAFCLVLAAALAADPFIPDAPAQQAPQGAAQKPKSTVTLELSELDAIREELRGLKAENLALRQKLDEARAVNSRVPVADDLRPAAEDARAAAPPAAKGPAIPAPAMKGPPRRSYSQIEVGMTRQDVDLFIKTHKDFKIVSVRADSGVHQNAEETVVRRDGTSNSAVRRAVGVGTQPPAPATLNDTQEARTDEQRQIVERRTITGKREIITVAQMVSRKVVAGQQRNSLGGSSPVYRNERVEGARLTVEMTDDVVTAVSADRRL